eukprot:Gb_21736 [translate_table: standard]
MSGEIPRSIGSLSSLRLLNLSRNHFGGGIPPSLGKIYTLEQLDLSSNELTRRIPQDLSALSQLAYINVSSNRLCGQIPTGTQFTTFNGSVFERNWCLCGTPLPSCRKRKKATVPPESSSSSADDGGGGWRRADEQVSFIAVRLGVGIGYGGVIWVLVWWGATRDWVTGRPHTKCDVRRRYGLYRPPR